MAYLRSIIQQCSNPCCTSRATQQVISSRNDEFGVYCGRHAKKALADRLDYEADDVERARRMREP